MTEGKDRDVGAELIKRAATGSPAQAVSTAVLARDRRRVRLLSRLTVMLWLVAVGLIAWLAFCWYAHTWVLDSLINPPIMIRPEHIQSYQELAIAWNHQFFTLLVFSCAFLALAMLSSVGLTVFSNRATLRQVAASLAEIAAKLGDRSPPQT